MEPRGIQCVEGGCQEWVGRRRVHSALRAIPNKSRSSTARDSAVSVEWEPLSELQRRIDEGVHYEHWVEETDKPRRRRSTQAPANGSVRGVFCGYRVTSEERTRLKSADPDQVIDDYSI